MLGAVVLCPADLVTGNASAEWMAEAKFTPEIIYCGAFLFFQINYTNTGSDDVTINYARGVIDWGPSVQNFYSLMGLAKTLRPGESMILDPVSHAPTPDVPDGTYSIVVTVGTSQAGDYLITKHVFSCDFQVMHAPPIENVTIQASNLTGEVPLTVDFVVSADGGLASSLGYTWIFGDGNETFIRADTTIQHTYTEPGEYRVIAWVGDSTNHPVNSTMIIRVGTEEAPVPPEEVPDDASCTADLLDVGELEIVVASPETTNEGSEEDDRIPAEEAGPEEAVLLVPVAAAGAGAFLLVRKARR